MVAAAIVSPIADYFSRQYPRMTFHVITGETRGLLRALHNRNIELVVSRLSQPVDVSFTTEVLFYDQLVLAAGLQNPLIRKRKLNFDDLVGQLWTLQSFDTYFGSLARDALRAVAFQFRSLQWPRRRSTFVTNCLRLGAFSPSFPNFFSICRAGIRPFERCQLHCQRPPCPSRSSCWPAARLARSADCSSSACAPLPSR